MKPHQKFNLWHLFSLVLAFTTGAAVFSNPRWFGQYELESDEVAVSNQEASALTITNDGDVLDDPAVSDVTSLPVPENIPIYLQNEIDDMREQTNIVRAQVDELQETVEDILSQTRDGEAFRNAEESVPDIASEQPVAPPVNRNRARRGNAINRDALELTGIDASTIDRLQQQQDEQALARLDLLDRAAREGYSGTDQLDNELRALRESNTDLQAELGDDLYDQYLYNAGSNNRIRVATVLSGSVADLAGIQVGDIIYQYGSTRVFNVSGLVSAIREGVRDEAVLVSIVRNNQPLVFDVTRAPLGVTLSGVRQEPGF